MEREVDVEQLRAAMAELEDAKIRLRRDMERQAESMRAKVLEELIPVVDNLERSIGAGEATGNVEAMVSGVKLVLGQLLATLERFGLTRKSAVGHRFDPTWQDAIAVIPIADATQDGVVVAELEPAYMIGDKVVRPAKVQVGRAANRPSS